MSNNERPVWIDWVPGAGFGKRIARATEGVPEWRLALFMLKAIHYLACTRTIRSDNRSKVAEWVYGHADRYDLSQMAALLEGQERAGNKQVQV